MMAQTESTTAEQRDQLDQLREKVAMACRILAQHAIVKGTMGHVSTRVPGTNDILIRGRPPVDPGLRFADPSSVIRVGPDARPIGATRGVKRVSEIFLHTEVYQRRPEVNAVIHAHAPWVRMCTICNVPFRPIFFEAQPISMLIDGLPFYERSITLHSLEETLPMLEVMGDNDICLLNRHGVVVAGSSVEDATHRLIELEHAARVNWLAAIFGDVGELPAQDLAEWRGRRVLAAEALARGLPDELHPGGDDDDGRTDRDTPWTYYAALLESGALHVNDSGLGI
jgi:ribulose-5-phosphate 4-epimerase/fuculose-1-phosphate aldolase